MKIKSMLKKIIPVTYQKADQKADALQRAFEKQLAQVTEQIRQGEKADADRLARQIEAAKREGAENVFAQVFHDTIAGSTWLKNQTFSPGRWAVGYPFLYPLYRVLDEKQPEAILELGLGQSTHMMTQYALAHPQVRHTVVEESAEWISFFAAKHPLAPNTQIVQMPYALQSYEGDEVRVYDGFADKMAGQKFDLLCIDAPIGGDMKRLSRIDVLKMLPGLLADPFVILMDDYNRAGEKNTCQRMEACLRENGIAYAAGTYRGEKDCRVIASASLKFLTSL